MPTVSLVMIVRDEEYNLPICMQSISGLFSEIIIVDTGSEDKTVELARLYSDKVYTIAWPNDFSEARNAGLARASGDYVFWLDADDRIAPKDKASFRKFLNTLSTTPECAYELNCVSAMNGRGISECKTKQIRLFPRRPGICWENRVHEQLAPSLYRQNITIKAVPLEIQHLGYLSPKVRANKEKRNFDLLLLAYKEDPDEPYRNYYLGWSYLEQHDPYNCIVHLTHVLNTLSYPNAFWLNTLWLRSRAYCLLFDFQAALEDCQTGLREANDCVDLLLQEALIRCTTGDFDRAVVTCKTLLLLEQAGACNSAIIDANIICLGRAFAKAADESGDLLRAYRILAAMQSYDPNDTWLSEAKGRVATELVIQRGRAALSLLKQWGMRLRRAIWRGSSAHSSTDH